MRAEKLIVPGFTLRLQVFVYILGIFENSLAGEALEKIICGKTWHILLLMLDDYSSKAESLIPGQRQNGLIVNSLDTLHSICILTGKQTFREYFK